MTKKELEALGLQDLSEDTVKSMTELLQQKIKDEVTKARVGLQSEIVSLKETVELMEHEREDLIMKADEYAESIREEIIEKGEEYANLVREEIIEKYGNHLAEQYADKLESYAQYVVEQFIETNKKVLVENKNYDRMKNVLETIRGTLAESLNLTVEPTDREAELENQLAESKEEYNKLAQSNMTLRKDLENLERTAIFESITKSLADTQREKVQRLIEGMDTKSPEDYRRTLKLMVEEVIGEKEQAAEEIVEEKKVANPAFKYDGNIEFPTKQVPSFDERMQRYLNSLK